MLISDLLLLDICLTSANGKRFAMALLFIVISIVTCAMISTLGCNKNLGIIAELQDKLKQESAKLETLKQRHKNLIAKIKHLGLSILNDLAINSALGPTAEYENLRRRIYINTKELSSFVSNQLKEKARESANLTKFDKLLNMIAERKRSLLSDQERLPMSDGHEEWRRKEAASVSDLVQRRLRYVQHPNDCRNARKLVCDLNKNGGFGCQLHHVVHCLSFAYATNRTVVLNSTGWRYNISGWESYFHPISSCTTIYNDTVVEWSESAKNNVLYVPFIEDISPKPAFILPALPEDLAHRIVRFNGDPLSWWIGQLAKYVLKPLAPIQKAVNDIISKMKFESPIVGIHIRRTDKIDVEATLHDIPEYMSYVDEYYAQLKLTRAVDERRVYLATDDIHVLDELQDVRRTAYHQYEFFVDRSIVESAALESRNSLEALTGLLVHLRVLSMCDHFVCTFSSNVGRLTYELMQTNRVDATDRVSSLDEVYYFSHIYAQDRIAVMANAAGDSDISLEVGDQIGLVPGDHRDGYDLGTNKRTLVTGLIPWYKTVEDLALYSAPNYKDEPVYTSTTHTGYHNKTIVELNKMRVT